MNGKKWIKAWAIIIIIIPIVGGFNYFIDPYGYNNQFKYSFNTSKIRQDARIAKFNLIKEGEYNSYIFGSSRNEIIDPELIDKHLPNAKTINTAFGGATIDEIEIYINFIIDSKQEVKYMFIPIDFFAFGQNFKSNGRMPDELSISPNTKINLEYFSFKMFKDSLLTLNYNLTENINHRILFDIYAKKGMTYRKNYVKLDINSTKFNDYIKKYVIKPKPHWNDNKFSKEKVKIIKNIYKKLIDMKIKVYIYTNPITYQQMLKGNSFLMQLSLLDSIINDTEISIYDFNNINNINLNYYYFSDSFHFNYGVANCIVDNILIGKSKCGNEFGEIVNSLNIQKYKEKIKKRYEKLRNGGMAQPVENQQNQHIKLL